MIVTLLPVIVIAVGRIAAVVSATASDGAPGDGKSEGCGERCNGGDS